MRRFVSPCAVGEGRARAIRVPSVSLLPGLATPSGACGFWIRLGASVFLVVGRVSPFLFILPRASPSVLCCEPFIVRGVKWTAHLLSHAGHRVALFFDGI